MEMNYDGISSVVVMSMVSLPYFSSIRSVLLELYILGLKF